MAPLILSHTDIQGVPESLASRLTGHSLQLWFIGRLYKLSWRRLYSTEFALQTGICTGTTPFQRRINALGHENFNIELVVLIFRTAHVCARVQFICVL